MTILLVIAGCALLGAITGLLSGLLGIGGGLVVVPVLVKLLPYLGVAEEYVMPIALGTSLATIVLTSFSAVIAHHKNRNIPWQMARGLIVAIAIGAFSGAMLADLMSAKALKSIFSVFVACLALYMIFSIKHQKSRDLPSKTKLNSLTFLVGNISSMMGIGGGAILIPTLNYFAINMRHAIGIASACSVAVALTGCIGYIIVGINETGLPEWSLGYVYLPALVGIISTSTLSAPLGVKLASKLPVPTLKKFFAVFLIIVAVEMLLS